MHTFHSTPAPHAHRQRIVSACAAGGASAAVLGLLLALFAVASSSPWLPDTPEAIAQAVRCDQSASRAARDVCMQQAVAHWQAAEQRGIRLASSR
jgi:hypothetical protein